MADVERRYRELEARREVPQAVRVRRGQVGLLLALLLAVLLAGVTAAVDLRRLQTPLGTGRAWAEATVFGDCGRHLELSVPAVRERDRSRVCAALQERSAVARDPTSGTRVVTRLAERSGDRAVVEVELSGRDTRLTTTALQLRRSGDGWVVERDEAACRLGCG